MKLLTVFFICMLLFCRAKANIIMVTSNADSGPGTLREAITLANSNGTTVLDSIVFNLPSTTILGRRITLFAELPPLTSNTIIDGSTQPGARFGVSDAKVELYFFYSTDITQIVIRIVNCIHVGIYGLKLTDNITWTQQYKETICIRIENSTDIEIGNIGKGNVMINWIHVLIGYAYSGTANETAYNHNIRVYSNLMGLLEDGTTAVGDGDLLVFSRIDSLQIGNLNPLSGNVLAATRKRIEISGTKGNILIANNKIGSNYAGTAMLSMPYGESSRLFDNINISNSPYAYEVEYATDVKVINNLSTGYCRGGIYLVGVGKKFYIQGNKIGTDVTGTQRLSPSMDYGIWVTNCRLGVIGVETNEDKEKNIIAFGRLGSSSATFPAGCGVFIYCPSGITVSRNSIFCNQNSSIRHSIGGAYFIPVVTINQISSSSVSGTAPPLSTIELFKDDSCLNCEVKTFFDTTVADASGNWTKHNINTTGIVVTATDPGGMTSEAVEPRVTFSNLTVKNATCGQNNGSITGVHIASGTWWHWENAARNSVGTDTVLQNVGPGSYSFVIGIGTNSCSYKAGPYQIQNISPPIDVTPTLTAATCGLANGSIALNYDTNIFSGSWWNSANQIAGTGSSLNNVLPGSYMFQLVVSSDTNCKKTYGPFSITNNSGPSINSGNIQITPARCSGANGSITGITSTNVSGLPFIRWVDSLNNIVGNGYNLMNIPPGRYRMRFKDASGCDTIITPFYTVGNIGEILIDASNKTILPAKCSGKTGSIQNIAVTGGDLFQWVNIGTGAVVGTSLNLSGLPAGSYQLKVTNGYGCIKTASVIAVPQTSFIPITVQSWGSVAASCGKQNGAIDAQNFSSDTSIYAFRWVDSLAPQTVLSTFTKIRGVYSGTYLLIAKDTNGCEQQILKEKIAKLPMPYFDYGNLNVASDNCLSGQGSITSLVVKDMSGGTGAYVWLNSLGDSVSNTLNVQHLSQGTFRLKATDLVGCTVVSQPIAVANINVPLLAPRCDDQIILINIAAALAVSNVQSGKYQWFDNPLGTNVLQENATGIFTTPPLTADRIYYVRYISGVCSSDIIPVKVTVIDKTIVYVPTGFTPNGDGKNDVLKIIAYGRVRLEYFAVYNRWGEVVFSSDNFSKTWDGKVNNKPVPGGVYVWILNAVDAITGQRSGQKGTLTVIR